MKERLKQLRKDQGLTQQEFADKIGVKRNTVATYEIGRNEPIDSVISLICDRFHVSETWLRTGKGEMYIKADKNTEIYRLVDDMMKDGSSELKARLVSAILKLSPEQLQVGIDWIKDTFNLEEADAAADQEDSSCNSVQFNRPADQDDDEYKPFA